MRKWFDTKAEATRFYNSLKQDNSPLLKAVIVQREDKKSLRISELVDLWYDLHGCTLARGVMYRDKLKLMAEALGNPPAHRLTVEDFAEYRSKRLNGAIVFQNVKNKEVVTVGTVNFEHSIFKAMFNTLRKLGKYKGENPTGDLPLFKEKDKSLSFLRGDEIERLLEVINRMNLPDLLLVVKICLSTGARWGEAVSLTASQVIPNKITFIKTKSGKNRTVPITPELYNAIPKKQGKLFKVSYDSFKIAIEKAGIVLPENQRTHILRHTFASHFMMNGGNILVLRDILGHYDIKMTMIYAHFAPSFLEDAVSLNPLSKVAI
ncbi:tyrosine-type recombinase/integrase [Mannheimia haemolytica]